jgi:hypothetical protein
LADSPSERYGPMCQTGWLGGEEVLFETTWCNRRRAQIQVYRMSNFYCLWQSIELELESLYDRNVDRNVREAQWLINTVAFGGCSAPKTCIKPRTSRWEFPVTAPPFNKAKSPLDSLDKAKINCSNRVQDSLFSVFIFKQN